VPEVPTDERLPVFINSYIGCPDRLHLHLDQAGWVQLPAIKERVASVIATVHDPSIGLLEAATYDVWEPEPLTEAERAG